VPGVGAVLRDHPGVAIFFRPRLRDRNHTFPLIQNVLRFTSKDSPFPNNVQLQPGSFMPTPWGFNVPVVTLACCVGKPRGHGIIRFLDANPRTRPFIDSRLLDDPRDRAVAVEGLRLGLACAETSAMRPFARLLWPRREVIGDPRRLEETLFRICDSGYHPCGTVPMGPDGNPLSAVTQYGRVRPVEGLWVADASVMPTVPSSNTNVPTLMIGERFGAWFRDGIG